MAGLAPGISAPARAALDSCRTRGYQVAVAVVDRFGVTHAPNRDRQGVDRCLAGGLIVEAGGSLVGAVGVSGAPGGDADEACARAGIEAIRDRLEF